MGAKLTKNNNSRSRSLRRGSQHSSSPTHSQPGTSRASENTRICNRIDDNYKSLDQVKQALAKSGLESSNLIVGIDFTMSNAWTGKKSFNGKCLHHVGEGLNPYEHAISIIGETLSAFDEDNLIPCFGFGDISTHDNNVFSFYPDNSPCFGFHEALSRYREIVPHVRLAGPTSFAPIIETAISIVDQSGGKYHVLLIIADGQVTRSIDTSPGRFSPQEQSTINAIVKASGYPLSIIVVGVGDGPWDVMRNFDDNIPARTFDNIQFVNFTEIMSSNMSQSQKDANFALAALMEIPLQYTATLELEHQLLGNRRGDTAKAPLPPPLPPQSYIPSCPPSPSPMDSVNCPVCFYNTKILHLGVVIKHAMTVEEISSGVLFAERRLRAKELDSWTKTNAKRTCCSSICMK